MDKIIPTLSIKPKKPRKVKKNNNKKLEFLNKPEIIEKFKNIYEQEIIENSKKKGR